MAYDFERCETRLNRNGPYVLDDVLAAIAATQGNYSEIANLLGRKRSKVRDFILSNPTAKAAFDDEREALVDACEAKCFEQAREGDGAQIRFILSTLGKNRGFSTRAELTGEGGGPIRVIDDSMSLAEAARAYEDTVRG